MVDARDRRRRRWRWLFLLGFTLLVYPLLLMGASYFGSSVGLSRDVNAKRALARALSYAADPRLPVDPGNDGELATAALDGSLVALQLVDGGRDSSGSLQALAVRPGSPSSIPGNGSNPTANPGGVGVGPPAPPAAAPSPTAAPPSTVAQPPASPPPTTPPVRPPPPPTPIPSPTPTPNCNQPPTGGGTFDGKALDPKGKTVNGGATLQLFWNGCLVATVVTGKKGNFAISGLAAGTRYNYVVTAPKFNPGAGSFTTDGSGNHSEDPQLQ
jgi:hypothetical protein